MTTIEWAQVPGYRGDVWNPTTGCSKVSQGCKHCYAETMHRRLNAMGVKGYERPFLEGARPVPERLHKPLKVKKPTAYFVNSMSDLFHEDVPFSYIDQVFAVMALCPQHLFLILTKRPERMAEYWSTPGRRELIEAAILQVMDANGLPTMVVPWVSERMDAIPNVWLGTSVEDQATADARIPHLLHCPAAVRFLSCEPLLGAVDLKLNHRMPLNFHKPEERRYIEVAEELHWVIAGGESGPGARPMHPDWARSVRDQCAAAGVPFFFKQWGAWLGARQDGDADHVPHHLNCSDEPIRVGKHASGNLLDGRTHLEWPRVITETIPA